MKKAARSQGTTRPTLRRHAATGFLGFAASFGGGGSTLWKRGRASSACRPDGPPMTPISPMSPSVASVKSVDCPLLARLELRLVVRLEEGSELQALVLAGGRLGDGLDELDDLGRLLPGDPVRLEPSQHGGLVDGHAFLRLEDGADLLAHLLRLEAVGERVLDARDGAQQLVDLEGGVLLAAALDELLDAADDEEELAALGVEDVESFVAGLQDAVLERLAVGLVVVEILLHHVAARDDDLAPAFLRDGFAELSRGPRFAGFGVDDAHLVVHDGDAD